MATVLITGASSGIGLELAWVFAGQAHDLVLVARGIDKLNGLAGELRAAHGIKVRAIGADLGRMDEVQRVYDTCQSEGLVIDFLVNNAGFGDYGEFVGRDWARTEHMIDLNIKALTKFCHLFLPAMVQRRAGRVLNVASTAAFQPGPLMTVYYASKSYVLFFSEALHNELKGSGVSVTCLCPGPTASNFQKAADLESSALFKNRSIPGARAVAEFGYRAMMKGKMTVIHGRINAFMAWSVRLVPRKLILTIVRRMQRRAT
jgi:uncharacterized protein